jgi:dihydrofolate reductase
VNEANPKQLRTNEALGGPTDVVPIDVLPTDVLPTDVLPTDVLPTDVLPAAVLPADVLPATVELVVAVAENDVIGKGNALPWHLPADLRHFRHITQGHTVLMGRKTHESIGKALPDRLNLILSRSAPAVAAGCRLVGSVAEARALVPAGTALLVIGGAEVYRQCLDVATRIHLTIVHTTVSDGDASFSGWRDPVWRETSRIFQEPDDKNFYAHSFVTLERMTASGSS